MLPYCLQYHGSAFKVAQLNHWLVFVGGHQMIDDIRRAPEDQLSFTKTVLEVGAITLCILGVISNN